MIHFESSPVIFTTGAFLKPIKTITSNGEEWWFWIVVGFEDDSFYDGEIYNPKETAQTKADLLRTE